MGLKIGWTIAKVPSDFAKLLIWKSIKLPSDVSDKVGVRHVVSALTFLTPNLVKRQVVRLRKKIPVAEWNLKLGKYTYTIATGSFGIKAFKTKIVPPQLSNLTQPIHKSHGKVAHAFRKSKSSVSEAFHKSKAKVSQVFVKES